MEVPIDKAVRGFRYNAEHFAAIETSLGNKYQINADHKARSAWVIFPDFL